MRELFHFQAEAQQSLTTAGMCIPSHGTLVPVFCCYDVDSGTNALIGAAAMLGKKTAELFTRALTVN